MNNARLHRGVLPTELISRVQDFVVGKPCDVSIRTWDAGVVADGPPVLVTHLPPELKREILDALTSCGVLTPTERQNADTAHYTWLPGSSIPWHTDAAYTKAATVYLNPVWDINWGGYLAYMVEDTIVCAAPEFNMAAVMEVPLRHAVLAVSLFAPSRCTLQVFVR